MNSLILRVDAERWRHHIAHYVARHQGDLVPVIKGNGYGFGIPTLAREAQVFSAQCVACYSVEEASIIRSQYEGDVLLLSPQESMDEPWIIHTLSPHSKDFVEKKPARFVIEILSPVKRHGFTTAQIKSALVEYSQTGKCEGLAIHLPIDQKKMKSNAVSWITKQLQLLAAEGIDLADYSATIWLSHVSTDELVQLKKSRSDIRWRVRVGTDLWLGARTTLTATAQVVNRHKISSGERVGYRQRTPGSGWLIIAAGGTSQGIGLEVPATGVKNFLKSLLRLFGWNPSPYSWNGKALSYVEAPHMHNSLLFMKSGTPPEVGEEIGLQVRFTTTSFDEVIFE
jgi:alanine racemase